MTGVLRNKANIKWPHGGSIKISQSKIFQRFDEQIK